MNGQFHRCYNFGVKRADTDEILLKIDILTGVRVLENIEVINTRFHQYRLTLISIQLIFRFFLILKIRKKMQKKNCNFFAIYRIL